ncbi:MAG: hypothetical protein Q8M15_12655 [Bacteroidota bacterium]|nr:hypothetical protein [Bacteroidota bacterium]
MNNSIRYMKRYKTYKLTFLLILSFLLVGSCKKEKTPVIEPALQGLWRMDHKYIHMEMLFNSDSVIQYDGKFSDSLQDFIYTESARGTFKILADTSFLNTGDSITYTGKHIKIQVWGPNFPTSGFIYGVFELSKDSLIIHTYCCKVTQRYSRIR